jgi:hypothetical protein
MKIKIFQAMTERTVEKKVNDFISQTGIEVAEWHYSATIFYFSVMIVYKNVD